MGGDALLCWISEQKHLILPFRIRMEMYITCKTIADRRSFCTSILLI